MGNVPVIVLGSAASRQYGISGMTELQNRLLKQVKPSLRNRTKPQYGHDLVDAVSGTTDQSASFCRLT